VIGDQQVGRPRLLADDLQPHAQRGDQQSRIAPLDPTAKALITDFEGSKPRQLRQQQHRHAD